MDGMERVKNFLGEKFWKIFFLKKGNVFFWD